MAAILLSAKLWREVTLLLVVLRTQYAGVTTSMNAVELRSQEEGDGVGHDYWLDSKEIVRLRRWLDQSPGLLQFVQQFAQIRVVVDANVVVQDLIHKVKFPDRGKTALQELIESSVLEVHAPLWLEKDLASAVSQVARRKELPEQQLWDHWPWYKEALIWHDGLGDAPASAEIDPKDVPYVVLQKSIGATGILSHDRHFTKMGGKPLTFEFIMTMRHYARASVVDVGIRISGVMLGTVAIGVIRALFSAIAASVSRLPSWLKMALIIAAIVAVLHPRARVWIAERWQSLGPAAVNAWNEIGPILVELGQTAQAKRVEAEAHLRRALHSAPGAG